MSESIFDETNFTIGNTTYEVRKLPVMEAIVTFEKLRNAVDVMLPGDELNDLFRMEVDDLIPSLIKLILKIDTDFLFSISDDLFKHIRFGKADEPGTRVVAQFQSAAFEEFTDFYEVLARALVINFGGSLRKRGSHLNSLINRISNMIQ